MIIKRIQKTKKEFDNGWLQNSLLIAEIHQEKNEVSVILTETSPMGTYIRKRVCKDATEAFFIAEEHTA